MATQYDKWGPSNERTFLDPTGASQNSNAQFPASPEANVQTSDDGSSKNIGGGLVQAGVQPSVLWKNPA
jgi:hypothetical protein